VVKERCEFRSDGSQRPWSMVCLEDQRILSFQLLTLVTGFGVVDRAVWRWARRVLIEKLFERQGEQASLMRVQRKLSELRSLRQAFQPGVSCTGPLFTGISAFLASPLARDHTLHFDIRAYSQTA
jgi:hypothetical protein